MKRKSFVVSILIILLTIIIPLSSYEKEIIKNTKKEVSAILSYNSITTNINIRKLNEKNELLEGAEFTLTDAYNNISLKSTPDSNKNYTIKNSNVIYDFETLMKTIPKNEFNKISKLNTFEDFSKEYESAYDNGESCYFGVIVPFILKETTTPEGYVAKEEIIILTFADINKLYNNNARSIDIPDSVVYNIIPNKYLINDGTIDFDNFHEDFINGKYDNKIKDACKENNESSDSCTLQIVNEKVSYNLEIENLVNNNNSITIKPNKILDYKVIVNNKSNTKTTNNVIITKLPKGFEYIDKSASRNGVYSREKHQIEWKIDQIESHEQIELTYQLSVPENVNLNQSYIGVSEVSSNEITTAIKSKETIVEVIKNPITSNYGKVITLLTLIIFLPTIYINIINLKNKGEVK